VRDSVSLPYDQLLEPSVMAILGEGFVACKNYPYDDESGASDGYINMGTAENVCGWFGGSVMRTGSSFVIRSKRKIDWRDDDDDEEEE